MFGFVLVMVVVRTSELGNLLQRIAMWEDVDVALHVEEEARQARLQSLVSGFPPHRQSTVFRMKWWHGTVTIRIFPKPFVPVGIHLATRIG